MLDNLGVLMRLISIIALGAAIAACSEEGGQSADSDEAFTPGTYSIVVYGGTDREQKLLLTLQDDKTFVASEVEATGKYTVKDTDEGQAVCFTEKDRPARDEACLYAGERKADGTWAVTRPRDDEEATLTRIED